MANLMLTPTEPIRSRAEENIDALKNEEGFEETALTPNDWTITVLSTSSPDSVLAMSTDGLWVEVATYQDDDVETAVIAGTIMRLKIQDGSSNEIHEDTIFNLVRRHNARTFADVAFSEIEYFPYQGQSFSSQVNKERREAFALSFLSNVPEVVRVKESQTLALWMQLGGDTDYTSAEFRIELPVLQKRLS